MKKNIYSLHLLIGILKAANHRYLKFISAFEDPSEGLKKLTKVSKTVKKKKHTYKGFNFFDEEDQKLLEVIARGEFNIKGMRNKKLREFIPEKSTSSISRIIKRLREHGLVKKARNTYSYYLTTLGKNVITTGLRIKNMFIVPELAGISVAVC